MDGNLVDEAQDLVDRLAARLRQSVAVDDPAGNLIAVSRHFGDADSYRVRLMLDRRTPREYRDYFTSYTRDAATAPVKVPARPDLSLAARIGFPIRGEAGIVAFLWLIDLHKPVPHDLIEQYCARLAHVLSTRRSGDVSHSDSVALEQHLRKLLAGTRPVGPGPPIDADGRFVALVHYAEPTSSATDGQVGRVFRDITQSTADLGVSLVCTAELDGCSVAVYQSARSALLADAQIDDWLLEEARRFIGDSPPRSGYGLSGLGELEDVRRLFARAALAAFTCLHVYREQNVVGWAQVEALAAMLTHRSAEPDAGPTAALAALLRDPENTAFSTVGAVLASGRNRGPADILHVHRTTLHYRLRQITELTGLDLAIPADRFLALTVWLRIALQASPLADLAESASPL